MQGNLHTGVPHFASVGVGGAGVLESRGDGDAGLYEHVVGVLDIGIDREVGARVEEYGVEADVGLCHFFPVDAGIGER